MASSLEKPESTGKRTSVVFLLRAEGLVVATATSVFYARTGASWWMFAALWLLPDLSMLGYLTGKPCTGARIYNAFHTYLLPAILAGTGLLTHSHLAIAIALIWANHIGVDRLLGYGLKYSEGFGHTHLGRVGRE